MSVEKSVVRSHVLNELGAKADDFLDKYRTELLKYEGAATGVTQAQQAVESVLALIDKEIDERRMDLVTGRMVKDWVLKASQAVGQVKTSAVHMIFSAKGKIEAAQQQVAFIKQIYDVEKAKLAQYTAAQTSENVIPIDGGNAGRRRASIKTRRLQEGEPPAKKSREAKKQGASKKAINKELPPQAPEARTEKPQSTEESVVPSNSS